MSGRMCYHDHRVLVDGACSFDMMFIDAALQPVGHRWMHQLCAVWSSGLGYPVQETEVIAEMTRSAALVR